MCDIYRNSILTIAASCSASDSTGFLQERIKDYPIEIQERKIDNPIETYRPQQLQSLRFRPAIDHSLMFRDDPIHTRAWTFQETILPHRLLSFGSRELIWECETGRQCECCQIEVEYDSETASHELGRIAYRKNTRAVIEGQFYVGKKYDIPTLAAHAHLDPKVSNTSTARRYAEKLLAKAPSFLNELDFQIYIKNIREAKPPRIPRTSVFAEYFYAFVAEVPEPCLQNKLSDRFVNLTSKDYKAFAKWLANVYPNGRALSIFHRYWRRVLVPEYTRRALSHDSDRLIALQAVASDIKSVIHDRYLAGLWESDLVKQLCWQTTDSQGLPAKNQSPSWSWSSIRGQITPYLEEELEEDVFGDRFMEIISADCSLVNGNPCGKILGGSIVLETAGMDLRYIKNATTGKFAFYAHARGFENPEATSDTPLKLEYTLDAPLDCLSNGSLSRSARGDCLDTQHWNRIMSATLLEIRSTRAGDLCVLLCGRMPETNHYRRIGIGLIQRPPATKGFDELNSYQFWGEFVLV